jgi:hypothetical protein
MYPCRMLSCMTTHCNAPYLLPLQNTSSKAWASQHAAAKTGMLGRETGFLLASSALALLHAAYTLVAWLVLPQLPFHTAHHAALAFLWLLVAGCCTRASRRCACVWCVLVQYGLLLFFCRQLRAWLARRYAMARLKRP